MVILKGVTIGDNCVIGAGCVVYKAIPEGAVIVNEKQTKMKVCFGIVTVLLVAGYAMKEIGREWLHNNKLFLVFSLLFVLLCCVFVRSIHIPYVFGYVNAIVGCGFIWMLSYILMDKKAIGNALSFVGKYSLPFYWLNGFVLVVARTIVVKGFI